MSSLLKPSMALPESLPVLPLQGVVLMPHARLPLNIFEPRYLSLVENALAHGRLMGLVQPTSSEEENAVAPLYQVGCAGRITSFSETDEGRFLIGLQGVSRFRVVEEIAQSVEFRSVKVDWQPFANDLVATEEGLFDRGNLLTVLRHYFKTFGLTADWNTVQNTTDDELVAQLTMICPLEPNEKQALLEASELKTRAEMLIALMEMACSSQQGGRQTARCTKI